MKDLLAKKNNLTYRDLVPGRWYKNVGAGKSYAKLSKLHKDGSVEKFFIDCYIYNSLYYPGDGSYYAFNDYKNAIMLTDLSEIQSFLPAGHIDKLLLDTEYNFRLWKFKVTDDGK